MLLAAVNVLLALGFAAAAVLQWNDPDPLPWMAIYGAAAVACLACRRARWGWPVAAAVGAVATVWAVMIAGGLERMASASELVSRMEMKGGPVEETREILGLGLVAAWMLVLVIVGIRGKRGGRGR